MHTGGSDWGAPMGTPIPTKGGEKLINWKVRLRHPVFYTTVAALIGFILTDSGVIDAGRYETYVELAFGVLVAGGVITDLTTPGVRDSQLSMRKKKPKDAEDMWYD